MIGQLLGHYRILDKLGAGGMGEVYRAHDERLDRDVALKVLPIGLLADESARKRFRKEALALSKLNHPNIATVHDFDSADGTDFLVMEYIPGVTLGDKLSAGPMPVQEILKLGRQLAEGLAAAHEHNVVHRDLKPGNLRLLPDGRLKILDFGLAKLVQPMGDEAVTASLTETHAVAGTLPYMAPEQLRREPVDARSDIWALGVVLYEMAVGARPFQGQTGFELSSAILTQAPPPLPSHVPTDLRAVIERCLDKEPGRRYQHAGEVCAALEAIQTGVVAPWAVLRYRLARRPWLSLAVAIVVVLMILAGLNFNRFRTLLGGIPRVQSLAVLPLENLSGDPEQEYFADGMTEQLITNLAKIGALKVISRTSMMQYKGTKKPLPQIAKELNVDALIEGSVLREGGQVRITAQLIQASTDQHLWAETYQRDLRGVLALQGEIASVIADKVRAAVTPTERARLASAHPVNPETYEAYLKGMFYLNQATPEGYQRGLAILNAAVAKDPADPLAYAGLASGYATLGHSAGARLEFFPMARAAATKALSLDETLAEAHFVLADVKLYYEWDWAGAEAEFQRAFKLNPSIAMAHYHYAWFLALQGRLDEAIKEHKRAWELDPLDPGNKSWEGWLYITGKRYDEAIEAARMSLELNPDYPIGHFVLAEAYAAKGLHDKAIEEARKAAAVDPASLRFILVRALAFAGRKDEARKLLTEQEKQRPTLWDYMAVPSAYLALGDKDEAIRWLEAGYKAHSPWLPWIKEEYLYEPLRSDPRFQDLVRRMNLPP